MTASLVLFHGTLTELLIKDQLILLRYKTQGTNFPEEVAPALTGELPHSDAGDL